MSVVTVAIGGTLVKDGVANIDLFVHSYYVGRPSPCVVIRNRKEGTMIGGTINRVEEIFQCEVEKHPGYTLKESMKILATSFASQS